MLLVLSLREGPILRDTILVHPTAFRVTFVVFTIIASIVDAAIICYTTTITDITVSYLSSKRFNSIAAPSPTSDDGSVGTVFCSASTGLIALQVPFNGTGENDGKKSLPVYRYQVPHQPQRSQTQAETRQQGDPPNQRKEEL